MAEDGSDVHVLSPMPELLSHWLPVAVADHLSTIVNDHIESMFASAPYSLKGIGMVPMQDVNLAMKRLEDLRRRHFCGVEIGTHIDGAPIGDARFEPFYRYAAELGMLIFVHPLHPVGLERVGQPRELASVAAFPLETALAATSLIGGQILNRIPKLRVLLSHGGGALPWIAPRLEFARKTAPSIADVLTEPVPETLKRFWYDTILYDNSSLSFLSDRVGADRLVVGSDYPFAIRQPKPGPSAGVAMPNVSFEANAKILLGDTPSPQL